MRTSRGFTLIEVMVAMAIAALGLAAVAASVSQMVDAGVAMKQRTYASWIAQNKIAELRLANTQPEVSSSSGEVTYANSEWEWRAETTETGIEGFYRIDVSVSHAGSEYVVRTVTGFLGEPGPVGLSNRIWNRGLRSSGATN